MSETLNCYLSDDNVMRLESSGSDSNIDHINVRRILKLRPRYSMQSGRMAQKLSSIKLAGLLSLTYRP